MGYEGFDKLKGQLAGKGIKNPDALAASIGRAKYGKEKFQNAAGQGKKMATARPQKVIRSVADLRAKVKGL